ncbi:UNVERIFIED_CONTAM: hypothetical protein DES50_111135 [Williamsia faeni]
MYPGTPDRLLTDVEKGLFLFCHYFDIYLTIGGHRHVPSQYRFVRDDDFVERSSVMVQVTHWNAYE